MNPSARLNWLSLVLGLGLFTWMRAPLIAEQADTPIDWHHSIAGSSFEQSVDGEWLSPSVQPPFAFEELIYSWHLQRPGQTFRLYLTVTFDDGAESGWLYAGYWGRVEDLRETREEPSFERGVLEMDWLKLTSKANGFRFKVVCGDTNPTCPPPGLTVIVTDNSPSPAETRRNADPLATNPPAPRVLDVPLRRQFDSNGKRLIDRCQSAALASALEYFGRSIPLEEITAHTFDQEYHYPGIWPRVTAAAQEFGFDARIERFRSWADVLEALKANQVILCSMTMHEGECESPPYPSMGRHIVAFCGLTGDGRVVVTDSFLGKSGTGYLCQWLQSDFEKIWMQNKGGVAMVILPPANATARLVDDLPPFPYDRSFPDGDDH